MVGTWYFTSASNDWYSIWYYNYGRTWSITSLPGWFFAEGERFLSFWRCHRPRKRAALVMWRGWFKPQLEIRHTAAPTTGAKHWHRQKAVFYVFVSVPQYFSTAPKIITGGTRYCVPPVLVLWYTIKWEGIRGLLPYRRGHPPSRYILFRFRGWLSSHPPYRSPLGVCDLQRWTRR